MKKILIIKLGALGDIVMATPLIEAILAARSGDQVTLLTTPVFAPLFNDRPQLEVVAHPRHGVFKLMKTLAWIRRRDFDTVFDLQGSNRSALLCAFGGIRCRVGNATHWPYNVHPQAPWRGQCHIFERMCDVLRTAGIEHIGLRPVLPNTGVERESVRQFCADENLVHKQFVLLHAGASATRPEKCWPYFAELAKKLLAHNLRPVWIGAESEQETNARLCRETGGANATNRLSLPALALLAERAKFAVANDSGPMHVLAAADIPVFGLFGPSDWRRNHALGQAANVIACVEHCSECAGLLSADCLDRVDAETVWRCLQDAGAVS